jgi:hypothetical protein
MRDKQKEDQNRGKANWEHLDEELHVLIQCEDHENRALVKLERAKEEIIKLLKPAAEGEDDLKKKQLMELAIINGTYREPNLFQKKLQQLQFPNNRMPIGAPLILTPRMQQNLLAAQIQQGTGPTMFTTGTGAQGQPTLTAVPQGSLIQTTSANGEQNFVQIFSPLQTLDQMGGMLAGGAQLFEYPAHLDPSHAAFPFLTAATATTPAGIKFNSLYLLSSALRPTSRTCCYCHDRHHQHQQHQHHQNFQQHHPLNQPMYQKFPNYVKS